MVDQEFLFHVRNNYDIQLDILMIVSMKVPSSELENRILSGVVQTYKAGRRKNVCWFNRNIIREDVMYGIAVSHSSSQHRSKV